MSAKSSTFCAHQGMHSEKSAISLLSLVNLVAAIGLSALGPRQYEVPENLWRNEVFHDRGDYQGQARADHHRAPGDHSPLRGRIHFPRLFSSKPILLAVRRRTIHITTVVARSLDLQLISLRAVEEVAGAMPTSHPRRTAVQNPSTLRTRGARRILAAWKSRF
jgi:hypothetical protein